MTPNQIKNLVKKITSRPLFIWGPPGIGKSAIVRQAADEQNIVMEDIRAVLLDPVDLRGIPTIVDGCTKWHPPSFLPSDSEGILFLDELPQAPPAVQAALLQLALDRRIGEYKLPKKWRIVAAGNRQQDGAGGYRLISPLTNRFIHIDMDVDVNEWLSWALTAGVCPAIRAFIKFRPKLLQGEVCKQATPFPTPRAWEMASDAMKDLGDDAEEKDIQAVVTGAVGPGAAAEFLGFLRIYRGLPDIDEVIKAAATCRLPTEPSVLYALTAALSERAKGADNKTLSAIYTIAGRMPAEYGILLVKDVVNVRGDSIALPEAVQFLKKHKDVLLEK